MKNIFIATILSLMLSNVVNAQYEENTVHIVGAMKNVMQKGELQGTIDLDTLSNKKHLYGLGPLENLTGELLIVDGKAYKSTVKDDTKINMEQTFSSKAPFFVYANVPNWTQHILPDSVHTIPQLEKFLHLQSKTKKPFVFKLIGKVESAKIHVVNLPQGTEVRTPKDAHIGQRDYFIANEAVVIIGFFSTEHQSIFTHHDSYTHMHLLTKDQAKMGHLDEILINAETKLFLPK